ncbi:MAG: DUF3455 domain-containing protein [Actinobacteria bacterium]|nr:DUF3455 domain-containing protein [Actinomycetota bacterium]
MVQVESSYTAPTSSVFALNLATTPGASALLFKNETLPPAIQVDPDRSWLVAKRIGVGVQVYDYHSTNGGWVFREPQADLYDIETGVQHGIHFAGPYWADADGSRVKGKVSGEADAPVDSKRNVKWLRLNAVENFGSKSGVFHQVAFIQRGD